MKMPFHFRAPRTTTSNMLSTAFEVWLFMKQNGGLNLDSESYDKFLPQELYDLLKLSLPTTNAPDLDSLLETNLVSVEEFLTAFFRVAQPFADMMTDLLRLFERAGAGQGKLNLAVRFNFDKVLPPLEFDLEHFRKWQETWQRVAGSHLANLWNYESLWQLSSLLRSMDARVLNPQIKKWLADYKGNGNGRGPWPDFEPPPPQCGIPELDATLVRVWRVWLTVVQQSKRFGNDREQLNRLWHEERRSEIAHSEREEYQARWPLELLAGLDSDFWAESFAKGTYSRAETISNLPEPQRHLEADALNKKLTELFDSLQIVKIDGEVIQRTLHEFLNLPIWKQRHELYSAWISTQIINALGDNNVEIHCVEGCLLFEFRGTHLATIGTYHPNLHLMAELRSALASPRGIGRKRAIQPDYSLVTSPITSPECSILEVECKQYLSASKRKFADALTDYANGRPNAHILLVNYGPATKDILDKVDIGVRNRTHVIGLMKPGSKQAQSEFAALVKKIVLARFSASPVSIPNSSPSHALPGQLPGQIVLKWENVPQDLDLHLNILSGDHNTTVTYSNRGSSSENPWAWLDQDIRNGHGPETIYIAQWLDGVYRFGVQKYSTDGVLAGCGARLLVYLGKQEFIIECPISGEGVWWNAFSYSPATGKIEIFNRISNSFP